MNNIIEREIVTVLDGTERIRNIKLLTTNSEVSIDIMSISQNLKSYINPIIFERKSYF